MTEKDPMLSPFYATDLSITIGQIKADSAEHAEELMNEFIDRIGDVMADVLSWDECDWRIRESVYSKEEGAWFDTEYVSRDLVSDHEQTRAADAEMGDL
jgi:hypothetical protein